MKIRGMGGWWLIKKSLSTAAVQHNASYEVDTEVDVRQTRSVGCGGWTEGLPRFRRVREAVFRVAEDDEFYPQALGFTEGREITCYLKRGALGTYDLLEQTIVESARVVNDAKKARYVEIVCRHGRYRRNAPMTLYITGGGPHPAGEGG